MNLYDYLSRVFGEKWDKNQIGIFAGQESQEEVKAALVKVNTLEEWKQFSENVSTNRGINISEMEADDALFVLLEELLKEKG